MVADADFGERPFQCRREEGEFGVVKTVATVGFEAATRDSTSTVECPVLAERTYSAMLPLQ
jgi:hypothetical protein